MVLFLLFFLAGLIADFDDAERNALQEVEPANQLKWLLEDVDDDLTFSGWLQTQVAPPPGVPQLRCDCVAALHSRDGKQPPWACLIEAQGQPLAGMAVWTMIYLGCFFIKNVRKESAEKTLDRIERGELGLCILVWVPLMEGGDKKEIVRRWRELAMRQSDLVLRSNYASLALVFAEMAGREQLWKTELEAFSMQESTVIRGWREEGSLKTARAAVLNVLETRFPVAPVPESVRSALEKNMDATKLTDWLREAVRTASPAEFEHFLAAPAN